MSINVPVLENRLSTLLTYPRVNKAVAEGLALVIRTAPDEALFRMNPLRMAAEHGWDGGAAVDTFIHAARVGLLDFQFNMLCPGCGGIEHVVGNLDEVPRERFHCAVCARDVPVHLDDIVEVTFSASEAVRRVHLDPFRDVESYRRAFFSPNVIRSPRLQAFLGSATLGFCVVPPDGSAELAWEAEPGVTYRVLSVDAHSNTYLEPPPLGGRGSREVELQVTSAGLTPRSLHVLPGACRVRIRNIAGRNVGCWLYKVDWDAVYEILRAEPNRWQPYLTARALLSNQCFRDLFRVQSISRDLRLSLRSITLLFTDLKGSTELYDRTGDVEAYQFVQEHFRVLSESVRRHRGAIIKTMGDAIMASFAEPADAAQAAVEMMHGMRALNESMRARGHDTGLKVGLHEGPALAVSAEERLDYFGQTVNVAARVQALAQPGEIWVTRAVMNAPGVDRAFNGAGYSAESLEVRLKGVGVPTPVHRLVQASAA